MDAEDIVNRWIIDSYKVNPGWSFKERLARGTEIFQTMVLQSRKFINCKEHGLRKIVMGKCRTCYQYEYRIQMFVPKPKRVIPTMECPKHQTQRIIKGGCAQCYSNEYHRTHVRKK